MSLCVVTHEQCSCDPSEGRPCPNVHRAEIAALEASNEALRKRVAAADALAEKAAIYIAGFSTKPNDDGELPDGTDHFFELFEEFEKALSAYRATQEPVVSSVENVKTVAVPVSSVTLCIEALEYTARFSYLGKEQRLANALKELLAPAQVAQMTARADQ